MMNKIIIENDLKSFDNEKVIIDVKSSTLTLDIYNEVTILDISANILEKLIINIHPNATLKYNKFVLSMSKNLTTIINLFDNSTLLASVALEGKKSCDINYITNMQGSNINNSLYINLLSKESGKFKIKVDGIVNNNTINNNMKESIKVLNLNNAKNEIIPNMLISSNEVNAYHFATISNINEEELFYLLSKGLSQSQAQDVIIEGFLHELFTQDIINNL